MTMIKCPQCGMENPDTESKCKNCGEPLEVTIPVQKRFCTACGKEIPYDAVLCPYCGCTVQGQNVERENVIAGETVAQRAETVQNSDVQKTGVAEKIQDIQKCIPPKIKKIILPIAIAVVVLIVILVVLFAGLSKDERLAYNNVKQMKAMMRDPDSFKLYDEMFLLKCLDDNGKVEYVYTIFEYGGTNAYGAMVKNEAIFKDDEYIMDYGDEISPGEAGYSEKVLADAAIGVYLLDGENDLLKMEEINIDKIKRKMRLR